MIFPQRIDERKYKIIKDYVNKGSVETKFFEFKAVLVTKDPKHNSGIKRTACAFANTDGGFIIFDVTASDLSPTSIHKASVRYNDKMNNKTNFIVDDIIDSHLSSNEFDFIFDRGCFHVISPEKRSKYTEEVNRILKEGGLLFLKCFSGKEPDRDIGPYRFSHDMIKKV